MVQSYSGEATTTDVYQSNGPRDNFDLAVGLLAILWIIIAEMFYVLYII